MRILHIINGEFYSGAERVQDSLVQLLPDYGYEPFLACLKPSKFITNCNCSKDIIYNFPMASKIDYVQIYKLLQFIKKKHIVLLHTHTPRSALVSRIISTFINIPRVHHFHSPTINDTEIFFRNFINTLVERFSVIGTDRFISVSESIGHWIRRIQISNERITVIPNGVSPFPHVIKGIFNENFVIGTVALFRPRKGLEILLFALKNLIEINNNFLLLAIGDFETAEYELKIKSLANQLNIEKNIIWRGFQRDIGLELNKMDMFVLPSLYGEGMPLVILEAMAAGLPVIASDVEGITEVVRQNREGIIVSPGDIENLTNAISKLCNDNTLRIRLGLSSRKRYFDSFLDTKMASRVANIYNNVLNQKKNS